MKPARILETLRIASRAASAQSGQSMLEFVFAALLAISFILGIMQIALVFNAHHMVQLAAFNAARAAIVARNADDSKPEEPVDLDEMKSKAKAAAFITLLPVIPDLHGVLPDSLANTPSAFQNLLGLNSNSPDSGDALSAFGGRIAGILMEYLAINVKFVKIDKSGADSADELTPNDIRAMDPARQRVEFDDRAQGDNNLIKVVVSWNYPLVIPFANRIFFAATNKSLYALTWIAAHPQYAQAHPLTTFRVISGDPTAVPVWGQGLEFETFINRTAGSGFFGDLARRLLYRVPVKASYVMRMQWDRMP